MSGTSFFNYPGGRRFAVGVVAAATAGAALAAGGAALLAAPSASASQRACGRDDAASVCAATFSRQQPGRDGKKHERPGDDKRADDKRADEKGDGDKRRDDKDNDDRRGDGYGRPDRSLAYDFGWYGKGGPGDLRPPRPQEWEETQSFMRQFAPRRHAAVEQMPEGSAKESVKKFLFARYRSLRAVQRRDPAGFEQRLAQLRVEDQIFGILSDWTGSDEEQARRQLRETLRTQVAQLVDLDLQERQRRVEWLKRELAEKSQELDQDTRQRDALVERRVARFADWADRWAARRKEAEKEGAAPTPPAGGENGAGRGDAPAAKPENDRD